MRTLFGSMTVAALAVGLAACETRPDTADDTTTMTGGADTMNRAGADTMGDMTRQQEGVGERIALEMEPVNDSDVSGEVHLTPAGSRTTVVLSLEPSRTATEGQRHMAHIHTGTCENIGPVVAPLDAVVRDSARGSTSMSVVDLDAATLMDGNHIVVAHEARGEPGRPVVCAEIQRSV